MTAKGKINASKVTTGERILVDTEMRVYGGDECGPSRTKTGATVVTARVLNKLKVSNLRGYIIVTNVGRFYAEPIQTMWLTPEDNAGIKRAHVEALAEDNQRAVAEAVELVEIVADEIKAADEAGVIGTKTFQRLTQIHDAVRICIRRSFGRESMGRLALSHLADIRTELAEAAQEVETAAQEVETAAKDEERWTAYGSIIDAEEAAYREEEDRQIDGRSIIPGIGDDSCGCDDDDCGPAPVVEAAHEAVRRAARILALQFQGRALRLPETGLTLPVRSAGRELVRISDIAPSNPLTLHSQAGKVIRMNNASNTQTTVQTETTPAERHTGSSVVALIERVWDRIRADHPELPEVVVTTGSGEGVKWGHFRPNSWKLEDEKRHEFFLASEALAKGAFQVLQTTLHEAAHTRCKARNIQDTSRQGRWHNAAFRKAAEEMGLEHKGATADKSHGFSSVTLTEATKAKYADLIAELDRELKLTGLLPFWMGGQQDEDERGGEKITGKPTKGESEGEAKSGPVKAVCDCEEPVIIRISQKVMDMGVVRCDGCESLFHRP
jgi:hypothetical protein